MIRRWLIRGSFLGLSLLCLGAWCYPCREHLAYNGPTSQECVFEIGGGSLFIGKNWGFQQPGGWQYYHAFQDPSADELDTLGTRLLGFQFFSSPPPPAGMGSFVKMPFWFLTIICLGVLWFVWRKTLPKPAGRAFPIEPAAKSGASKS